MRWGAWIAYRWYAMRARRAWRAWQRLAGARDAWFGRASGGPAPRARAGERARR